jgi:hypothetical protein
VLSARGAAILACAMLLASCSSPHPVRPPISATTPADGETRKVMHVKLDMEGKGGDPFKLSADTHLVFYEIYAGRTPPATWFLSISAPVDPPLTLTDGRSLLFSADLAPGLYHGAPGTYTLDSQTAPASGGVKSPIHSGAYVRLIARAPTPLDRNYDTFAKPCTMTVAKDLRNGTVGCPQLGLQGNAKASESLHWTWTLT